MLDFGIGFLEFGFWIWSWILVVWNLEFWFWIRWLPQLLKKLVSYRFVERVWCWLVVATAPVLINATLAINQIWETSLGFRPSPKLSFIMILWNLPKSKRKTLKAYIAYRGLIVLYHRGKALVMGTLANFFVLTLGSDGKSNEQHRKNDKTKC